LSAQDLGILDSDLLPHVIEPSFGIGRLLYTILEHNFKERDERKTVKFFFLGFNLIFFFIILLVFLFSSMYCTL
jgi:glycyl-tRNA synthetase (class II)